MTFDLDFTIDLYVRDETVIARRAAVALVDPDAHRDAIRRNQVRAFMTLHYAADPTGRVMAGKILDDYRAQAQPDPLDKLTFARTLDDLGIEKKTTKRGNERVGIRERKPDDPALFADDQFEAVATSRPVLGSTWEHREERRGWYETASLYESDAKRLELDERPYLINCELSGVEPKWGMFPPSEHLWFLALMIRFEIDAVPANAPIPDAVLTQLRALRREADLIVDPWSQFDDMPPFDPNNVFIDVSDLPALAIDLCDVPALALCM